MTPTEEPDALPCASATTSDWAAFGLKSEPSGSLRLCAAWPVEATGQLSIPQCYGRLWDHINGDGSWERKVAAYTFRVIKQNIDQTGADHD